MRAGGRKFERRLAALAALLAFAGATGAQTVSLSGSLGNDKALLVIDGSPRTVAVGSTVQGVRLIGVDGNEAVVEVGGKRAVLRLGAAQVNLGGKDSEGGGRRMMAASGGGHFMASGSINGRATQFVVDTGASYVSIGQDEAERLGLKYRDGALSRLGTANGEVTARHVTLQSLRIGDVQVYEVQAIVMPAPLPYILLGNSFLTRFQMKRDNDTLTLDRRY